MTQEDLRHLFRAVGDGSGLSHSNTYYEEELALAFRNRGMPLEGLRYDITPTGMHYLLIHFDIPAADADSWQLDIGGLVSNPISLSMADIRQRPRVTMPVTMECAGNGRARLNPRPVSQPWLLEAIGTAEWAGTPLRGVLEEAGVGSSAVELVFTGSDEGVQGGEAQLYQRSLTVNDAMRDEVMLAYEMNGAPLEPQHGYPLRLIVPGWYGMTSVKWLNTIEAVSEPFTGYQMDQTYRYKTSPDDPGEPVSTMRVRALMIPPGIPDFMTRTRLMDASAVVLSGKAWAGRLGVTQVEVSVDDGMNWQQATLGKQVGQFAWRNWSFEWDAKPGRHYLSVRATDEQGNVQPSAQPWTLQGMGNNLVQRVEVIVR
ncbi:MAG: sulfite oxidase [Chloroflexi bacterium]|nr:sulfite oxidase [Chloroflexota bacterium]